MQGNQQRLQEGHVPGPSQESLAELILPSIKTGNTVMALSKRKKNN